MDLPPDFHIEFAILNMHVWMIVRRLKKFNSRKAELMIKVLEQTFERHSMIEVSRIHLKKKNDFIKDLNYFCMLNRENFEKHFFSNFKTSQNPYFKIDAMVWSTIFFEKVERYSDRVYLMSEYLVKHFRYINSLSLEEIESGQIDLDIYRNSLNFKQKIQEINPPLTQEEFDAELNNSNPIKKFFYNFDDPDHVMPIDIEKNRVLNRRLENVIAKLDKLTLKFDTLDNYDYFNEREEKNEEKQKRQKKYAWKGSLNQDLTDFMEEKLDKVRAFEKNK